MSRRAEWSQLRHEIPIPPALARAAVDEAVSAERRRLADHVADLTDEQWATPSLCAAWTVRDVVAHLTTTTRTTMPRLLRAAMRARGSLDRMEVDLAAERAAAYTTAELVAQVRESAGSTRRTPGSAPMDPLMDLVIHGQDVARPLGRRYVSPPKIVAACLAYVAMNKFMGGPRRLSGVRPGPGPRPSSLAARPDRHDQQGQWGITTTATPTNLQWTGKPPPTCHAVAATLHASAYSPQGATA